MTKTPAEGGWDRAVGPGGQTRTIREAVARRVWIAAGGRCTICKRNLLTDETTGQDVLIGQLAHIVGWSTADRSPRGKSSTVKVDDRNEADNLMLLCYDQHKVIDDKSLWETFDEDTLRRMKHEHETDIRRLTGLGQRNMSTVLRVLGGVGDVAVVLSRGATARYMLERDRFPDYALLGRERELEIDLRAHAGQAASNERYWAAAADQIAEVGARLRAGVEAGEIERVSVLALARIPVLVMVGAMLGEAVPVELYPTRRSGEEGFGWTPDIPTADFSWQIARYGDLDAAPAVVLSISGKIDIREVADLVAADSVIYEVSVDEQLSGTELICSQESLDNFTRCWRDLLGQLEGHGSRNPILVFPAVPVVAAVTMGRLLIRGVHAPLAVFDRDTATRAFKLAMEVSL